MKLKPNFLVSGLTKSMFCFPFIIFFFWGGDKVILVGEGVVDVKWLMDTYGLMVMNGLQYQSKLAYPFLRTVVDLQVYIVSFYTIWQDAC